MEGNASMFIALFGIALTAALLATAHWGRVHAADMGAMSRQWVVDHHASERASSM